MSVLINESTILIDWFTENCMQANPSKFQAIAVGSKTFNKHPVFTINTANIICEETVKLLGIDIDYKLNFDFHITNICRKAAQQLNILKRIGHNLTRVNKLTIFHSFILSHFNFCPMAWHFCSKANTHKMEKVQERALRFIYEDYDSTYDQLLLKAKTPSLEIKRLRSMAIECFKIIHDLSPPCLSDLVSYKNSSYNFRYSNLLEIPHVRTTTYGKKSFKYAAPMLWNQLPENFRLQTNFLHFRNLISNWTGKECKCNVCSCN